MTGTVVAAATAAGVTCGVIGTAAAADIAGSIVRTAALADMIGRVITASQAKRLGTGKTDFNLGGELVQELGSATVYAGGSRKFGGKAAGSTVRDTWSLATGVSYRLPGRTIVGVDYDWQEASFLGNGPSSEITGWVNFDLTRRVRMQVFAST